MAAIRFANVELGPIFEAAAKEKEKLREGGPVNYAAGVPTRNGSGVLDVQGGHSPEFAIAVNQESPDFFFGENGVVDKLSRFEYNAGLAQPQREDDRGYA